MTNKATFSHSSMIVAWRMMTVTIFFLILATRAAAAAADAAFFAVAFRRTRLMIPFLAFWVRHFADFCGGLFLVATKCLYLSLCLSCPSIWV